MIFPARMLFAEYFLIALLLALPGRATVFNWPTTPAFPTGPTNGQSVSAVYGGLGAVTLTNNGGGVWQSGYPVVNNTESTGGNTPAVNGLQLYLASEPNTTASIRVNIVFGYTGGATNSSIVIWDVDRDTTFTDKISNIVGITTTGTAIAATSVVGSADNSVSGSGTTSATDIGTASNAQGSGNANVTISFGGTAIRSIQFDWSDAGGSVNNQTLGQAIGISPVTFTPVGSATPEVGSALGSLIVCTGVVGCGALRRRSRLSAI
jgi:hypothetical protein